MENKTTLNIPLLISSSVSHWLHLLVVVNMMRMEFLAKSVTLWHSQVNIAIGSYVMRTCFITIFTLLYFLSKDGKETSNPEPYN